MAEKRPVIIFMSPANDALDVSLRDAITAQLAGDSAEVVFEHFVTESTSLRDQVSEARSMASAHDAIGVFWLDAKIGNDWLVYLAEPSGDRVLVRRVAVDSSGPAAAAEAVAVITRQSALSLAAGESIGMQPVRVAEESPASRPASAAIPKTTTPPVSPRPNGLDARIAYAGDLPVHDGGWQSGLRFAFGYRARTGPFVGMGFVLYNELSANAPGVTFRVNRYPFDFDAGMAFGRGRFVPAVELRGIVEVMHRQTVAVLPEQSPVGVTLTATPGSTREVFLLAPRVSVGYAVSPRFELYGAFGVDFALNKLSYRTGALERNLLDLRAIRPALELGGAFWP